MAKSDYQLHYVCLSVRMDQLGCRWKNFREFWCKYFSKSCRMRRWPGRGGGEGWHRLSHEMLQYSYVTFLWVEMRWAGFNGECRGRRSQAAGRRRYSGCSVGGSVMGEVASSRRRRLLPSSQSEGEALYMLWLFVSLRILFSFLTALLVVILTFPYTSARTY
jgi:hypothetical protein